MSLPSHLFPAKRLRLAGVVTTSRRTRRAGREQEGTGTSTGQDEDGAEWNGGDTEGGGAEWKKGRGRVQIVCFNYNKTCYKPQQQHTLVHNFKSTDKSDMLKRKEDEILEKHKDKDTKEIFEANGTNAKGQ